MPRSNDAQVLQHRSAAPDAQAEGCQRTSGAAFAPPPRREMLGRRGSARHGATRPPPDIRKMDQKDWCRIPAAEPARKTIWRWPISARDSRPAPDGGGVCEIYPRRTAAPEDIETNRFNAGCARAQVAQRGPRHEVTRRTQPREDRGPASGRTGQANATCPPRTNAVPRRRDGEWRLFRLNVGRERNADPKWLLPEICRQGEVTRRISAPSAYSKWRPCSRSIPPLRRNSPSWLASARRAACAFHQP